MAFFLACIDGIADKIFTQIVATGADLTMPMSYSMNALHLCIYHRSLIEKVQVLLKNGINVNGKDEDGKTSLFTKLEESKAQCLSIIQELI